MQKFLNRTGGLGLMFATLIVVVTVWWTLWFFFPTYTLEEGERLVEVWSWSTFWLYAGIAYVLLSIRFWDPIREDELGVRIILGIPTDTMSAGPPFLPFGLAWVIRLSTLVEQMEVPGPPEKIYRGEMKGEPIPEGHVPPIRVPFAVSIDKDKAQKLFGSDFAVTLGDTTQTFNADVPDDGISNRRVTAEVVLIFRWRIEDGVAFVRTIGSRKEANRQLEDTGVALITRIFTKISVAQALQNLAWASALLFKEAERRVDKIPGKSERWGIIIETAQIKVVNFHHDLNRAIGNATEAPFAAQQVVTASEAEQTRLTNEGAGTATAAGALEARTLAGRAEGLKAIADLLGITPEEAASLDVARALGQGDGTFVLGGEGLAQLATVHAAILGRNKGGNGGHTP